MKFKEMLTKMSWSKNEGEEFYVCNTCKEHAEYSLLPIVSKAVGYCGCKNKGFVTTIGSEEFFLDGNAKEFANSMKSNKYEQRNKI